MKERNKIEDKSGDRNYFIITPRLVWARSRSPYDYMLWSVIKDIAGENYSCTLSTRKLATLAMMSAATVCDSRDFLLSEGLLNGEKIKEDSEQMTWILSVPDLWEKNTEIAKSLIHIKDRLKFKTEQQLAIGRRCSPKKHLKRDKVFATKTPCSPEKQGCIPGEHLSLSGEHPFLIGEEDFENNQTKSEEKATAPFPETENQPQDQKQEKPNAETLPTETRSDCAAPAPIGGMRSDSKRPEPSVACAGVGEDRPSWVRYVAAYYNTRDEHSILKHLKAADKLEDLTGEKVAAWCSRCGTLQEWLRSNVDGTFSGKTNGRSYSNSHSNGHANGNGKFVPQFKPVAAPAPTIDENTLALMFIIAQVTFKNLTIKQHSELCQVAAVELAKVGATCEIITAKFGANSWWYQKDWRGQKGSCPTPAQLIEVWGQWENTNGATGANGTNRSTSRNGFIPGRPCQWKGDDGDGTPKPVRTSKRTYDV